MNWNSTKIRYGWLLITIHWLMLLLIAAAYTTMEFKSIFPKGSPARETMAIWHYMLGLSVFFLVWLRLLVRLAGSDPVIEPALPTWQVLSAKVMHRTLYILMIGLPLLGWLILSAKGTPVPFFGLELPALIGESKGLAKWLKDVHEATATIGYFLIGIHAAAALYHHYFRRDNTLKSMWYGR
ncbi:MAG: cytochrome b [Candidatus Nitrotoga sp.]